MQTDDEKARVQLAKVAVTVWYIRSLIRFNYLYKRV